MTTSVKDLSLVVLPGPLVILYLDTLFTIGDSGIIIPAGLALSQAGEHVQPEPGEQQSQPHTELHLLMEILEAMKNPAPMLG